MPLPSARVVALVSAISRHYPALDGPHGQLGTRLRQDQGVTHVALVFPGRRYGLDMPLLRYSAQALSQMGADVQVLQYPDGLVSADSPSEEQLQEVARVTAETIVDLVAGTSRVTLLASRWVRASSPGCRLICS